MPCFKFSDKYFMVHSNISTIELIATGKLGTWNLSDDISKAYQKQLPWLCSFEWSFECLKLWKTLKSNIFWQVIQYFLLFRYKIIPHLLFAYHTMWFTPSWSVLFLFLMHMEFTLKLDFFVVVVMFSPNGMKYILNCTMSWLMKATQVFKPTITLKGHQGVRI